ncbi:MAG: ammonium transporter [Planctomycetaceae bacterium]|nr:ammonium transporter [Planctomycetaceae bacterium]
MTPEVQVLLNTLWVVTAAILVFFMQAGFALVESGMVRAKNAINVIMKNYCDMCVGALGFWAVGYGLMFGLSPTGWFGTTKFAPNSAEPFEYTLLFFQMMFAATAATIVSGALAERIRFNAYLVGSFMITTLIYPIYGSWAWNDNGWLKQLGFIDFAGSTVVHTVGACCALAGLAALGPRTGRYAKDGTPRPIPGHNLPFVALGGFILWLGWFGFNAGSTTAADVGIGRIALNTHLAGCASVVGTIFLCGLLGRPVLLTSVVNASLAGLVAITAGCAFVTPGSAILIGLIAAPVMLLGEAFLDAFKLDDAVGAIPVHGFCGVWGTFAVGIFKESGVDVRQMCIQLLGSAAAFGFVFPVAYVMYRMIGSWMKLRVASVDEQRGLDYAEHGEVGYPEFQDGLLHGGTASTGAAPATRPATTNRPVIASPIGRN